MSILEDNYALQQLLFESFEQFNLSLDLIHISVEEPFQLLGLNVSQVM